MARSFCDSCCKLTQACPPRPGPLLCGGFSHEDSSDSDEEEMDLEPLQRLSCHIVRDSHEQQIDGASLEEPMQRRS